ncbi:MAG TPA: hypothetical protein P5538_08240 [Bacteroidales bacterium]|jgi:transposase-like protein/CRISPR/Cas system CMR-associated protein Cmr5 small subunit|nr:hypothetical protein [Bacteroidales bacterium]HOL98801.1 hypothetical protein [Bacteroidales bacterium]HOM37037.1 hypothetical protein [Bacteroidales bacterium]HPD24662.1 hypothetical protein [Bacteroidales bacterium]HRT00407.1 hypothetical protein [Bacteroidales bacterium]
MKKLSIKEIKEAISELNSKEYKTLIHEINHFDYLTSTIKVKNCIYCQSKHIIKHGRYNHLDRYKCKDCGKTFIPTTGTAFYYIHKKHNYLEYFKILAHEGIIPIAKIKKRLNIATQTAFDWRHKFLMAFYADFNIPDEEIFIKELNFNFSQKGRRNISKKFTSKVKNLPANVFVTGNSKYLAPRLSKLGDINKQDFDKIFKKILRKENKVLFQKDISISDFLISLNCEKIEIPHVKKSNFSKYYKIFDNSSELLLKQIINKTCRGVATKYLQSYSNFLAKLILQKIDYKTKYLTKQVAVWYKFIQAESLYVNFIVKYSGILEPFNRIKRFWKNEDRFHHLDYGVLIGISKIY